MLVDGWNIRNFDGGIRDPRIWNPESTALKPESRTVLYSIIWGDKAMLSPQMFTYLGSVISNEDGSRRDINKVRPGKV